MADIIAKLQVDSGQFDQKLKAAVEQMTKMEQEVRRTGATFAYADKEELEFIKSLGEMGTQASSAKSKMREYSDAITSLTATYRAMTDEEKKSEPGKALAASIDNLKIKAAELKDIMSDTNVELRNLSSDTNFTDGLNLMTRALGSCAAAVTAWTGDGKEMEAVIKDLAKIGTTVAAVDALTKAFQKQNLVLLKNPYVLAAAGVSALAVAMGKLIKKSQELSQVEKDLQEVQKKGRDDAAKEITRIQTLNNILHDNTRSMEDRNAALKEIKALVPEYHGALTTEGNLINDNTDALQGYISKLQQAATAQAAFDKMVEINKNKLAKQLELGDANKELAKAQENYNRPISKDEMLAQAGSGRNTFGAVEDTRKTLLDAAQSKVDGLEAEIKEFNNELDELQKLVDASSIAPQTKGTKTTKTSGGSNKTSSKSADIPVYGSLGDWEAQASAVQQYMKGATSTEEYKELEADLEFILEKIREIKGEGGNVELTFSESGLSELGKQIKEKLSNLEFGSGDYLIATNNLIDFNTLQTLLETAVKNGLDFDKEWFNSLFEDVKIGADVDPQVWQAAIDEINRLLHEKGLEPIKVNLDTGSLEEAKGQIKSVFDEVREELDKMSAGVGAISTLGNAFNDLKGIGEDLADAFSGEMDAWDALMTVFNSGIGIMETVIGVMDAINTLNELSIALSGKRKAEQALETAEVVGGKMAEATAEGTEAAASGAAAGANAAEGATAAGKSVAWIPIVGPILAAAAIAATIGAMIAAMSKAKSAGSFSTGGVVGGNSNSGDRLMAYVNSGETILTPQQADKAMAGIQGGGQTVQVQGQVSGTNILLVASNAARQMNRNGGMGFGGNSVALPLIG